MPEPVTTADDMLQMTYRNYRGGEALSGDFTDCLAALCSREAAEARGDTDRAAAMIDRLAASLGFAIAVAAGGDARLIDEMLTGAEGYAHQEAVAKAPFARMMAELRRARPAPDAEGEG